MAQLTLKQSIDMSQIASWDGDVVIANASQIRISDGYRTQDYFGTFNYNSAGYLSGGTLTATDAYQNGLYFSITGMNVNAAYAANLIDAGDVPSALKAALSSDDQVYGSEGNDVIIDYAGNDQLYGNAGNDIFHISSGTNHIDGGAGFDLVKYTSNSQGVAVGSLGSSSFTITEGKGQTNTFSNIERVTFLDNVTLATDVGAGQNAGSVYRIYQAAFDRAPDAAGLKYWINDADNGASIQQIAQGFVDSNEYRVLNPGLDSNSMINNLYKNVLSREADPDGFAYWQEQLASGMSENEMLVSFSESNENIANTAPTLDHGLWLL